MEILILGSGGREHAFAWKMKQSPECGNLYIAPGNAGTSEVGMNVDINAKDFNAIKDFVLEKKIEMVVVGPEDPLVAGIHDFFLADASLKNIPVIGPTKDGAMLEGSKDFSKAFMQRHGIPTARYESFLKENIQQGFAYLETLNPPYVLKADGLAAGKGVVIVDDYLKAKEELSEMLEAGKFGFAGSKVVIEEFLSGIELSVFVLTDGKHYKILPEAKDYKRIGDNDTGLNTGGMGAVSPVAFADKDFMDKVENTIVKPTIHGLQKEGINYTGFIFIGIMNVDGTPYVIEYNARMGDPETEVVMPRIKTDLVKLFKAVGNGTLNEIDLEIDPATAVTVMLVSGGYPGEYEKGKEMNGLQTNNGSLLFHAGTTRDGNSTKTAGGRVLAVTSLSDTLENAIKQSYSSISGISFSEMYYRRDIGQDLMKKGSN